MIPYVSDFGEEGRKESKTNIYFVDGGDIPYVALSEYMPFLSEVLNNNAGTEPIDYRISAPIKDACLLLDICWTMNVTVPYEDYSNPQKERRA